MYVTLDYYVNTYGGDDDIDEEVFVPIEKLAEIQINFYTFNRIVQLNSNDESWDKVKMCMCQIIDAIKLARDEKDQIASYNAKTTNNEDIASESVGSQSITFTKPTLRSYATIDSDLESQISDIVEKTLAYTGLTYRGIHYVY